MPLFVRGQASKTGDVCVATHMQVCAIYTAECRQEAFETRDASCDAQAQDCNADSFCTYSSTRKVCEATDHAACSAKTPVDDDPCISAGTCESLCNAAGDCDFGPVAGGDLSVVGGRSGLSYMSGGNIYINGGDAYRPSIHDGVPAFRQRWVVRRDTYNRIRNKLRDAFFEHVQLPSPRCGEGGS